MPQLEKRLKDEHNDEYLPENMGTIRMEIRKGNAQILLIFWKKIRDFASSTIVFQVF